MMVIVIRLKRGAAADVCSRSLMESIFKAPPKAVFDALICSARANCGRSELRSK